MEAAAQDRAGCRKVVATGIAQALVTLRRGLTSVRDVVSAKSTGSWNEIEWKCINL